MCSQSKGIGPIEVPPDHHYPSLEVLGARDRALVQFLGAARKFLFYGIFEAFRPPNAKSLARRRSAA